MSGWLSVDGEAEDGKYSLLCDSDHRHVYKQGGLSTQEIFDFLLSARLKRAACFGLNYDANNWLVDLPHYRLHELWTTGRATYVVGARRYRLSWIPGKSFAVALGNGTNQKRIEICEVWGYFQSSFVKACEKWGLETQDELQIMKSKRGTFTKRELKRVMNYCFYECDLLSELMGKIVAQCEKLEIEPEQWIGAGSLASALMKKHGVKRHVRHDLEISPDPAALTAILRAYFGGRVEMYRQGDFSDVHTYDINSAYPAAATRLPSLVDARLKHVTEYDPKAEYAIWRVSWDCDSDSLVTPFPARVKKEIFYPLSGEGCYHAQEVAQAVLRYPLTIHEGWILEPGTDDKPFAWIPRVYEERARLKRENDHAEKVLKLALNSVYGKLAQGKGYRNQNPAWQSYFWAGQITSDTRAQMLAFAQRKTPLMISTDGIFFEGELPEAPPDSTDLGGISHGHLADLWIGQPGVYWGRDKNGVEIIRSRGFFARDIDYAELRKGFQEEGSNYVHLYESTRFIGLGVALQRNNPQIWRTWKDEHRHISLRPTRRIDECSTDTAEASLKPLAGPMKSEPYTPKGGGITAAPEDFAQGLDQPLRS